MKSLIKGYGREERLGYTGLSYELAGQVVPATTVVLLSFSLGADCPQVIDAIATAIRDTAGCTLLDIDPGASTNRTVYTFVGGPAAVVRGAFNAAQVARSLIDMAVHKGKGA
jgi:glutamate formiminotransferase